MEVKLYFIPSLLWWGSMDLPPSLLWGPPSLLWGYGGGFCLI
jgi:hypothetical protein